MVPVPRTRSLRRSSLTTLPGFAFMWSRLVKNLRALTTMYLTHDGNGANETYISCNNLVCFVGKVRDHDYCFGRNQGRNSRGA
ncbi:hypothetical protein KFL_001040170 [Klebsormidium nitens]|uniref:Uncharacterized protein n=1 Tax=Klebsormidium nitens TaxID=105231 RepID=A0A1Y1HUB7_KLENI|nr:hypothetical protein KFL_001040170 [Klebsormidium nitens]|eukprot:GAQ82214.1 hypothetical protein KFL_001040170 [Klebsormidium nitens]